MKKPIHYKNVIQLSDATNLLQGSIYVKDKKGVYLNCNLFQAQMAGFTKPEEVIGKTDYDLPWKYSADNIRSTDERIMKTGVSEELEESGLLADGSEIIMLSQKSPLYNAYGKIIGIMGVSLDITHRKKAEERERNLINESIFLKAQIQKEEELILTMKMIAGAIAHEMRTPLMAIAADARWIKKIIPTLLECYFKIIETSPSKVDPLSSDELQELAHFAQGLHKTTRDAFTVIDMLMMNLKDKPVDGPLEVCSMQEVINKAVETYPLTERERSCIHWEKEKDFIFRGKNLMVQHVLFNLLKNALYYVRQRSSSGVFMRIEIGQDENFLFFKDTGPGIPEEILPHIFDRFFSKTAHGTGIGLAFCKHVMKELEGDITCHSLPQEYTEFKLSFPKIKEN